MTSLYWCGWPVCGHVRCGKSASQSTASKASAVLIGRKKCSEYLICLWFELKALKVKRPCVVLQAGYQPPCTSRTYTLNRKAGKQSLDDGDKVSDECFIIQEAFEKCWAHSPLRAAARRLF